MMRSLLQKIIVAALLLLAVGCVDLGVDEQPYVCRAQSECGPEYICVRGPGCYCVCAKQGTAPEANCQDPMCENVTTQ
jgi:hypothetical protein